ncbi:unnamed protein product [Rotaria sp. Silwood2]|nr:unnamed protein product [Rotaria sp. Silwood2]
MYRNANTRISGDSSRSVCAFFRVSSSNVDNIIVDIGSAKTTSVGGCNRHFALGVADATHINVFGLCGMFDNNYIFVGPDTLYDGNFHQICITYNSTNAKLCVYRDAQEPICITRNNGPYNTSLGNVRIGWWPDDNRQFVALGGGLIRSVSLFDSEISQDCVIQEFNRALAMNTTTNTTVWSNTTESNTCNYHGRWHMGECVCEVKFDGQNCSMCDLGYFNYPNCYQCSDCESHNGTCNYENDTCICEDYTRFTGLFCAECQPGYYGSQCTNSTQLLFLQPTNVSDVSARDGIDIILIGAYFYFSSLTNVLCLFQSSVTWAVVANSANVSTVVCALSNYTEYEDVYVSLSLDNGTTWVNKSYNSWNYSVSIHISCPTNGSCLRGECRLGSCECPTGYTGYLCDQCDIGYFFIISTVYSWLRECTPCSLYCQNNGTCANSTCICRHGFTDQMCDKCQENRFGSLCLPYPIIQSIDPPSINDIGGINLTLYGLNFNSNESSGLLSITSAVASLRNYTFTLSVSNSLAATNVTLIIEVPPSYIATVSWKKSHQYLSASTSQVLEYSGNSTMPYVPILIWIENTSSIQLNSDSQGHFSGFYLLSRRSFGGQLHIAASHPATTSPPASQDIIFIVYLRLSLSQWIYGFHAGYPTNFTDFATIRNVGDFDMNNLTINLIHNTPCIQEYSTWPLSISVLPAFSTTTLSLSMLLNCSLTYEYMSFSINESRSSALTSSGFIITSQWSCRARNDCNSHGSCIDNETCSCTNLYSGDSCQQCASNRFAYPTCINCPVCVRGQAICNNSAAFCDCIDKTRIYGPLCQYCQQGYYGDNCTTIPIVFSLSPTSGSELSNKTHVTLYGDNFQNVSAFCLITDQNGTTSIPATFISYTQITCIFPTHSAELVRVQLRLNDSMVSELTKFSYQYLPSCSLNGCNPGYCVLDTCQCQYPYFGINCSLFPIPPLLRTIPDVILMEMSLFSLNISQYLTQGDSPLDWYLSGTITPDLSIDPYSGLLTWSSAVASSTPYNITVNVHQSSTGVIVQQNFVINVGLGYNVTVRFQNSQRILTTKTILQINGQIVNNSIGLSDRIVKVWVRINNIQRYLPAITVVGQSNQFTTYYTPLTKEYGTLFVGAQHPADLSNNEPQDYLTLLGLNVQRLSTDTLNIIASENFTNTFAPVARLSNPCDYPIENLTFSLVSPLAAVSFFNVSSSNCNVTRIPPLTTCSIELSIRFNVSGSGNLVFAWTANDIQPVTLSLPINVMFEGAEFKLNPSSSSFIVPRESQETLVISIYNTGSRRLGPLTVLLPNQTYVSVLTSDISTLIESANDSFTLGIQIPESAPLSTFTIRGYIVDRINSLSRPFQIQLTIVGNNDTLFDLNILCRDEFSYFGSNTTNLANVTITITNSQLNIKHFLRSNETGQVSVSLVAGTYEITAQALKHSSYRGVIKVDRATATSNTLVIFLQRILVSYVFKVSKISIDQTYTITMDTQFVTYVPAPVLVISPAMISLDELEANEYIKQIDFTFTNYGLIRLSDIELTLPDEHPYLRFSIRQLPIGNIEANSSIIVAVDVYRINMTRRKRASCITSIFGSFIATYICGEKRTVGASLPAFICKYSPPINIPKPNPTGSVSWSSASNSVIGGGTGGSGGVFGGTGSISSGGGAGSGDASGGGAGGSSTSGIGTGIGDDDSYSDSSDAFSTDLSQAMETFGSVIETLFNPVLSSSTTCESCVDTFVGIAVDLLRKIPGVGSLINKLDKCLGFIMNTVKNTIDLIDGTVEASIWNIMKTVETAFLDGLECLLAGNPVLDKLLAIISKHSLETKRKPNWINCLGLWFMPGVTENSSSWNENVDPALVRLNFVVEAMTTYREMISLIYGDSIWFDRNCVDQSWEDALTTAKEVTSDLNYFISAQEYNELILLPHRCANQSLVSDRLLYYNRTMYSYSVNITEPSSLNGTPFLFMSLSAFLNLSSQYMRDLNYCRSLGYSNLFHAYIDIFQQYYDANKDPPVGICATVTIRIVQNVTIARQGFAAEMTIDNSGADALYDIQITLDIQADNQSNANDRFSIGETIVTDDAYNGSLTVGGSAQFNWLIIPYLSAAPTASTWYSVGGQLSYTIAGQRVNITLLPDRIQVDPEARLDIAYFLEENVIGPDPLSLEWVASQPFILAVVITNNGYGSANNFRVSSGQPTIVDNEKGLAVTYRIIGMKINREQQSSIELSATLGDLQPFSTSTITWIMLSSLKGYFRTFNASYMQINPNGDPKLSLFNSLTTHRLQHVVSLDILVAQLNDTQIDYLVNELDGTETAYSSTNATLFFPVVSVQATVQYYSIDRDTQRLIITVSSNQTLNSSFIHLTLENSFPKYFLISSKRIDDDLDITINTWLTHNVDHLQSGDRIEDLLHVFDMTSLPSTRSYEIILSSATITSTTTAITNSLSSILSSASNRLETSQMSISSLPTMSTPNSAVTSIFDNTLMTNPTLSTISMQTTGTQILSTTTERMSSTSSQNSTPKQETTFSAMTNQQTPAYTSIMITTETTEAYSTFSNPTKISSPLSSIQVITSTLDNGSVTSSQSMPNSSPIPTSIEVTATQRSTTIEDNATLSSSTFRNSISTEPIESTRMEYRLPSTANYTFTYEMSSLSSVLTTSTSRTEQSIPISSNITLWTTQSTAISTMLESTVSSTSYQYLSTESMLTNTKTQITSSITSMPAITTNAYIRFTLSFSMNDGNQTRVQLVSQLLAIFTSALGIHSNQINITVIIPLIRTLVNVVAQVRLFDSATESADSLLAKIRQQLADPSSALRRDQLTSQLTNESISDVRRMYNCGGSTEQETPCGAPTTTHSTSTSSLTTILLATIIPSAIGAVLLDAVIVFIVRRLRQSSRNSFFADRSYHELTRF